MKTHFQMNQTEYQLARNSSTFTDEERKYMADFKRRADIDGLNARGDYQTFLEVCLQELEAVRGIFGDRIAIDRWLKYQIGIAYEGLGTVAMKNGRPAERFPFFESAVEWYQAADETVGMYTDYALRQSESAAGAAHYRQLAGLNDEKTQWYRQRSRELDLAIFGEEPIIIQSDSLLADFIKATSTKEISSSAVMNFIPDTSERAKKAENS